MIKRAPDEPLFVVDNAEGGRNGLGYLHDWCEVANSIDVATGYFEIGALTALDGQWQKLDGLRILMGDETSQGTKKAILEALQQREEKALDRGLEADKRHNPFLEGVDAVVAAIKDGRIRCRVYNKDKFHAKAYITHGRLDVVGSQALVGSSNFTCPGLTKNVELNIKIESSAEVAELQRWYEQHWDDAEDVSDAVLKAIERHTRSYSPFEVYARALHELFGEPERSISDWEQRESQVFDVLDQYQKEAYWALTKIAQQRGGALLCDGVGLGKTFVGLMLIERLVRHENRRVVLFAPKGAKEGVWEPAIKKYLSHIGGVGGSADFSNLTVFSHTDLSRVGDFPERFERVKDLADVVVIDEAHHFRNPGRKPKPDEPRHEWSRYHQLLDLIEGDGKNKPVYMLTATPINNSLDDFRHLVELFTGRDEQYFARTLGINSLTAYVVDLTRALQKRVGDEAPVSEHMKDADELLSRDRLFRDLVVQRSRAYVRRSQEQEKGAAAIFPDRVDPVVADYSIRKTYGNLLDLLERAFERDKPLFALPVYYPLYYYTGPDTDIDPREQNRQAQVVGLIRTNFLKRFESSAYAFERSCDRLMRKLMAFLQVNNVSEREQKRYERWIAEHEALLAYTQARQLAFWGDEQVSEEDADEDVVTEEFIKKIEPLPRDEYDVEAIFDETYLDLDQLAAFLDEAKRFEAKHDDKLQKLIRLLKTKQLLGRKVLIFTEFADTARYLRRELRDAGIDGVFQVDSGTKGDRFEILQRFAPYYNGSSSAELVDAGKDEIRVLVSTDVLSEGLNLQDATRLVNYDIHWNPVRLMQRIGRVDRRLTPETEERIKADHPEVAGDRRKVAYWNFLPPGELDDLLGLYKIVSNKTLLISRTLGIEGKKFITPDDDYEALKDFNAAYEGSTTPIEELHLEYQRLLDDHPDLEARLAGFPSSVFSGRKKPRDGIVGVFFCYRLPALDAEQQEFTLEAGSATWYFDPLGGEVIEDTAQIAEYVRTVPDTPRSTTVPRDVLVEARDRVEKHVKNSYLKRVDAPVGVGPKLVCWMELNEG